MTSPAYAYKQWQKTSRLEDAARTADAAFENEKKTRERVRELERRAGAVEKYMAEAQKMERGLWGRLRWLLTGR